MTKYGESVKRAETPKPCATPPIRNEGASPASCRIQASKEVVVVLPCVPATPNTQRPHNRFSASHCGPETYGKLRSRIASSKELPREIAFPITYRSGFNANCATPYPSTNSIPCSTNCVLIGG